VVDGVDGVAVPVVRLRGVVLQGEAVLLDAGEGFEPGGSDQYDEAWVDYSGSYYSVYRYWVGF